MLIELKDLIWYYGFLAVVKSEIYSCLKLLPSPYFSVACLNIAGAIWSFNFSYVSIPHLLDNILSKILSTPLSLHAFGDTSSTYATHLLTWTSVYPSFCMRLSTHCKDSHFSRSSSLVAGDISRAKLSGSGNDGASGMRSIAAFASHNQPTRSQVEKALIPPEVSTRVDSVRLMLSFASNIYM
jgi:hypothetical protein